MSSPPNNPNEIFRHTFAILCVIASLDQFPIKKGGDYRQAIVDEYNFWLALIDDTIGGTTSTSLGDP